VAPATDALRAGRRLTPLSDAPRAGDVPAARSLAAALEKISLSHDADARQAEERRIAHANAPRNKLQQLWHDYGFVGIGTYLGVYVCTLGTMYLAISSGVLGGDVVLWFVDKLGMADHFSTDISPKSSSFLLAWVATKLTEPPRLAVAVILTPYIARMLGRAPPKQAVAHIAKVAAQQIKAQVKKP